MNSASYKEFDALVFWSPEQLQRGLPTISETTDPAWFSGEPGSPSEGWSLTCRFESPPSEQGNPSKGRVRFYVENAPHQLLRPGVRLHLFERDTGKLANVAIVMTPHALLALPPGLHRLTFADGEVVRARILSVDPDVTDNHLFYEVVGLETLGTDITHHEVGQAVAASASAILSADPL